MRLSELQGMFNLGQIYQNYEEKIWKPAYCHQPVLCSLIEQAVSTNWVARYMEILTIKGVSFSIFAITIIMLL